MRIKDMHTTDMPREKLVRYGAARLSDHELLAVLLGSGTKGMNVLALSKKVLALLRARGTDGVSAADLAAVRGIGAAKGAQIIALLALTERLHNHGRAEVLSAKDVWSLCHDIRSSKKEHFVALYLDTQNRVIERIIVSIGTLNSSLVHPREVFEPALKLSAAHLLVAHNHPSGSLEPSPEDIDVTIRLKNAGELLGINLLDHVILTDTTYKSISLTAAQ
ncbi:hypothetical protein A3C89_03215 [Candidatus Kaiserbacteria bacterium RIFCSPHIGHO2_02_FULL_50_50]|uniref:MPN domain-containing protein n=1 Tax=Candidatus Kaiserbacteria bacterium RIFCSPHIGHO2_02_FULL_50_50 TaxID=1798492 RepID=A0A1F6DES5_9BACT|nr:MAG: hypothetical protein A3C89_03215 [Candidatus Kaiserbacteria bacterium RIFCSPHIGHO2_02_FULL_50_50]OGG88104.1 MAG: hypothetical protein A3G62_02420 [Candidatus Kaiserbacteria bacterium RIFCSPLOWO2_12_FULL_50_10]